MQVRQQRAVLPRPPPEKIKQRCVGRSRVTTLSDLRSLTSDLCLPISLLRSDPPHRAAAFIETKNPSRRFVEPNIAKISSPFRKPGAPLLALYQSALVCPIPRLDPYLHSE